MLPVPTQVNADPDDILVCNGRDKVCSPVVREQEDQNKSSDCSQVKSAVQAIQTRLQ